MQSSLLYGISEWFCGVWLRPPLDAGGTCAVRASVSSADDAESPEQSGVAATAETGSPPENRRTQGYHFDIITII